MNKYRKLLGSSRGTHFRESGKRMKYSAARRRQSVKFRRRYAESVLQKMGNVLWAGGKVLLVLGATVWIVGMMIHMGRKTTFFQTQSVIYEGEVPHLLRAHLPFKQGQSLFSIQPRKWEASARQKFSEIKSITINRTLFRNVVIRVQCRRPIAIYHEGTRKMGVDGAGELFPVGTTNQAVDPQLPKMGGKSPDERKALADFLGDLQPKNSELFSLIESIDISRKWVFLTLRGGIRVDWGLIDEKNIFEKAKNILRLLHQYTPNKEPAVLRFVTEDRIVMNSDWILLAPK